MAQTNYGVILGKQDSTLAYATIGKVVSIDPPEYTQPEIESTNHASGGVREYISGMLAEMAPFKATVSPLLRARLRGGECIERARGRQLCGANSATAVTTV